MAVQYCQVTGLLIIPAWGSRCTICAQPGSWARSDADQPCPPKGE